MAFHRLRRIRTVMLMGLAYIPRPSDALMLQGGDPGGRAGAVVGFGHAVSAGQGLGKR